MGELLNDDAIENGLAGLTGWHREGDDSIRAEYRAPGFLEAVRLVDQVALAADRADHHPDIDIRYDRVVFTLSTHSDGGVTAKDLSLATEIAAAAEQASARPV